MSTPVLGSSVEQAPTLPNSATALSLVESTQLPDSTDSLEQGDLSLESVKVGVLRRLAMGLGFTFYPPQIRDAALIPKGQTSLEKQLVAEFPALLDNISLEDNLCMGMAENGQPRKIPHTIDRYRLAPITPPRFMSLDKTDSPSKEYCRLADDVQVEYPNSGSKNPYMDTLLGIGLVYDDRLVAVSGACLGLAMVGRKRHNAVAIKQIQAVHATPRTPKEKFKTGLHSGILWRDTLVQTWQEVAGQLDVEHLVIQGAINNQWNRYHPPESAEHQRFVAGYDEVADRNGFTQLTTGNWHKTLV